MHLNMFFLLSTGKTLVNKSAKLSLDLWKKTFIIPAAKESLHLWNAIDTCFFLRVVSGFMDDLTTDSLSQKTLVGPSSDTPIILNLYLKEIINSVPVQRAMYSDPNVEVSTVFCLFEYQMIGSILQNIRIPV